MAALALLASAGGAGAAPTIVSINLCSDQLGLALADRAQILAVGRLATDPALSALHREAAGLPTVRGAAEEVLALKPDLVLSGAYRERKTNELLRRMGFRVAALTAPDDVPALAALLRRVGAEVGHPGRGERAAQAVTDLFREPPEGRGMAVLVWRPNGFVSGRGTLVDAALAAAGLDNAATRAGIGAWGTMPLERLATMPPDLLVLDDHITDKASRAQALLVHPVLARLAPPMRIGAVATRDWLCAGPWMAAAVARLRALKAGP